MYVDEFRCGRPPLSVLEAGCGSASHVDPGPHRHVVGLDISQKQLARNSALDERIVDDIQTAELAGRTFDLVVCWDVLEHLSDPKPALATLMRAVGPGGILVIAAPNVLSLKGLITKFTPHWAHVLVYRYIFGNRSAGKNDVGPFKTYLRLAIAPDAIIREGYGRSLSVRYFATYESPMQKKVTERHRLVASVAGLLERELIALAQSRAGQPGTDFILLLQKTRDQM